MRDAVLHAFHGVILTSSDDRVHLEVAELIGSRECHTPVGPLRNENKDSEDEPEADMKEKA